jgi:hypothetical protein
VEVAHNTKFVCCAGPIFTGTTPATGLSPCMLVPGRTRESK